MHESGKGIYWSCSIARLPLYESLDTIKIDVSDISAEQTAKIISEL